MWEKEVEDHGFWYPFFISLYPETSAQRLIQVTYDVMIILQMFTFLPIPFCLTALPILPSTLPNIGNGHMNCLTYRKWANMTDVLGCVHVWHPSCPFSLCQEKIMPCSQTERQVEVTWNQLAIWSKATQLIQICLIEGRKESVFSLRSLWDLFFVVTVTCIVLLEMLWKHMLSQKYQSTITTTKMYYQPP